MRRLTMAVSAVLMLATGVGCKSVGRKVFKEPVVNFKDVRVNGLGLNGGSLDVVLSVYNPNGYRLDATKLTYNLMVDSVHFGQGQLDSRFVVNSGDSSEVRLPVTFTYAGLGAAGRELLNTGSVNYHVLGDITVGTPLGDFTRHFDQVSRFNALRPTSR